MESKTFEQDGRTYYATPDIVIRVNGMKRISPVETFEWCCENMELSDVTESEVFPQYHAGEGGEEDYVSYSDPLVVVKKERFSAAKDTRWLPRR